MSKNCPLCNNSSTTLVEMLRAEQVNSLYEKSFGIKNPLDCNELEYRACPNCELRFFWPLKAGDEALYEKLQRFDWYYMNQKNEYDIAMQFIPLEGEVLEVGSGKAAFVSLIGKERYTGIEFNDDAISAASLSGITLVKETVEEHAHNNPEKYVSVVSFQVLEHVSSPVSFIKGCLGALKSGGSLIIAVPSRDGFSGEAINDILNMPPHHVSHWSEFTLRKIADIFGLEVASITHESVASYHQHWARKIKVESVLRKFFRMKPRLLDLNIVSRGLSYCSKIIATIFRLPLYSTKGHTIVVCYRKP